VNKKIEENFKYFIERCLYYRKDFDIRHWEYAFGLKNLKGNTAEVDVNTLGWIAEFTFDRGEKCEVYSKKYIDRVACHETVHLVLSVLEHMINSRYAVEKEVDEEVKVVCNVLKDHIKDPEELLKPLVKLAKERFVTEDKIEREVEKVVEFVVKAKCGEDFYWVEGKCVLVQYHKE